MLTIGFSFGSHGVQLFVCIEGIVRIAIVNQGLDMTVVDRTTFALSIRSKFTLYLSRRLSAEAVDGTASSASLLLLIHPFDVSGGSTSPEP